MEEERQEVEVEVAKPEACSCKGKAIASLVLGIVSILSASVVFIGLPASIVGLILGGISLKSAERKMAMAGVILSIIGLILTIIIVIAAFVLVSSVQRVPVTQ